MLVSVDESSQKNEVRGRKEILCSRYEKGRCCGVVVVLEGARAVKAQRNSLQGRKSLLIVCFFRDGITAPSRCPLFPVSNGQRRRQQRTHLSKKIKGPCGERERRDKFHHGGQTHDAVTARLESKGD